MTPKLVPLIGITIITVLAAVLLIGGTGPADNLSSIFLVDAIYYASDSLVQISFEDTGGESTLIIMEVLGMAESYQRYYENTVFTQNVTFTLPPKFGWKVNPVTFVIEHPSLGKIGIKTEIHGPDEPKPPVIFSHL